MIAYNNKKIGFIVDTSSNIKSNQYDDVYVTPLYLSVTKDNETKIYKDNDPNFPLEYFSDKYKKENICIRTSQTHIIDMNRACEEMSKKFDQVFVLPINKFLSSSGNTWNIIQKKYPKVKVIFINDFCCGYDWDIKMLKEKFTNKKISEKSIQNFVNSNIKNNRFGFLFVNDTSWIVKGGRVSNFKSFITKLFKLKPIVFFNYKKFSYYGIVKNYQNFVNKVIDYLKEKFNDKKPTRCYYFFNKKSKLNNEIIKLFKKALPTTKFIFQTISLVFVTHTGIGYFGIYFDCK